MARPHIGVSGNALTAMGNFGGGLGTLGYNYLTPEGIAARKAKEEASKLSGALDKDAQAYLDSLRTKALFGPVRTPDEGFNIGAPTTIPGATAAPAGPLPIPAAPPSMPSVAPSTPMSLAMMKPVVGPGPIPRPVGMEPKYGSWADLGGPEKPATPSVPGAGPAAGSFFGGPPTDYAGRPRTTLPLADNPRYFTPGKGEAPDPAGADSLLRERDAMAERARDIPLDRWGMLAFRQPQMVPGLGKEALDLAGQDDPVAIREDQQRMARMVEGNETDIGKVLGELKSRVARAHALSFAEARAAKAREEAAALARVKAQGEWGVNKVLATTSGKNENIEKKGDVDIKVGERLIPIKGDEARKTEKVKTEGRNETEDVKNEGRLKVEGVKAGAKPKITRQQFISQKKGELKDTRDRLEREYRDATDIMRNPDADPEAARTLFSGLQKARSAVDDFDPDAAGAEWDAKYGAKAPAEAPAAGRWQDDPEALRIRDNPGLTADQKRAALEALKARYAR